AMFPYFVSRLLKDVVVHTIDISGAALEAVKLLNERQSNIRCVFHEGDSRAVFPSLYLAAQFAWIDGGHETDIVISDVLNCYRLQVPYVAVDDSAYPSVTSALRYITDHTTYASVPNPFAAQDRRRAVLLSLAVER